MNVLKEMIDNNEASLEWINEDKTKFKIETNLYSYAYKILKEKQEKKPYTLNGNEKRILRCLLIKNNIVETPVPIGTSEKYKAFRINTAPQAGNIYINLTSATHAACGSVEAGSASDTNLTSATHAACGSVEAGLMSNCSGEPSRRYLAMPLNATQDNYMTFEEKRLYGIDEEEYEEEYKN